MIFRDPLEKTTRPGDSIRDLFDSQRNVGLVTFTTQALTVRVTFLLTHSPSPLKGHVELADVPGVDGAFSLEKEHFHIYVIMAI